MVEQPVGSYTFSQKRQVKTLASAAYVKTSTGERIEIDPRHLYQRLLIMGVGEIPLVDLLQYELCSFPAFLFDNQLFMRSGDKAELIHHLVKLVPECINFLPYRKDCTMSSMGLDFFTNSRGRSIPPTPWYAQYTRSILLEAMTLRLWYIWWLPWPEHGGWNPSEKNRERCWRFGVSLLGNAPNDEQEDISINRKE